MVYAHTCMILRSLNAPTTAEVGSCYQVRNRERESMAKPPRGHVNALSTKLDETYFHEHGKLNNRPQRSRKKMETKLT